MQGQISGVLAPALTPFDQNLRLDTEKLVAHCQWLLAQGCTGLVPFGTTSEASSLAISERMETLEALVSAGIDPQVLVPGTGTTSIRETIEFTSYATELGCAGSLVLPPFYFRNVSDDGVFAYFQTLIETIAHENLRIYLYHIPSYTQVNLSVDLIQRLQDAYPAHIVGVKDSSGDWAHTEALLKAFPDLNIFVGSERYLLDALRLGGAGSITAVANVNPGHIRVVFDTWQSEQADALQARITLTRGMIEKYPTIPSLKALLAYYRQDPDWGIVRPPLLTLPAEQYQHLIEDAAFVPLTLREG